VYRVQVVSGLITPYFFYNPLFGSFTPPRNMQQGGEGPNTGNNEGLQGIPTGKSVKVADDFQDPQYKKEFGIEMNKLEDPKIKKKLEQFFEEESE